MRHDETQAHDSVDPLDDILAAVLLAQSSGQGFDRERILREHPAHAAELATFLDDYGSLDQQFAPLRQVASSISRIQTESPTIGREDTLAPTPQAGSTFGGYELLTEIARGGMGVVYKARQRSLNRIVALKMVLGGRRDASTDRERFLAEAKAVARLSHPHIVPIYEVGEHDGQSYFTMQFIAGGSLRERQEEFRNDQRAIAQLVATVARAVEHAHRRGILHRDIKPSNVLLDDKRQPHVTDFGLAKQLDDDSNLTQAGAVVGTPGYMAPEQASGHADVCTAVDVYGLGAVLYELLTGRPPFKGETPMETLLQVMQQEPKPPRQLVSSVDPDLETVALKCLEKDPARRYGSADAVADDLERWLSDQPIQARPVTRTERLLKWSRRQPLAAGSLAMTAAVALALLVASGFLWRNAELRAQAVQDLGQAKGQLVEAEKEQQKAKELADEQTKLANQQRKLADEQTKLADKVKEEVSRLEKSALEEKDKAQAAQEAAENAKRELEFASDAARRTLYAADMQLASVAWQSDNIGLVQELVDRYRNPQSERDLRGFEWTYFDRRLHIAELTWPKALSNAEMLVGADVSVDGKSTATAMVSGEVRLWNTTDGSLTKSFEAKDVRLVGVFFDAEGRRVTAVVRKNAYDYTKMGTTIYPAMLKKEKFTPKYLTDNLQFLSWNLADDKPGVTEAFDGAKLAGPLQLAIASGIFIQHEGDVVIVLTMNQSSNGQFLAMAGSKILLDPKPGNPKVEFQGGRLLVWDNTKQEVVAFKQSVSSPTALTFSHDKQSLAVGYSNGTIDLFADGFEKEPRRIGKHRGSVGALAFSGDDLQLASGGMDATVTVWNVATVERDIRFVGDNRSLFAVKFTPDGEHIVSADMSGELKLWNLHFSGEPLVLRGHQQGLVSGLNFSQDSNELISADIRGTIKTWKLPLGIMEREAKVAGAFNSLALANNGRILAAGDTAGKGKVFVKDLVTGEERAMILAKPPVQLVMSADGKYVGTASLSDRTLTVSNATDVKKLAQAEKLSEYVRPLGFSPDNKLLAASSQKGLVIWNWETGETRHLLDDGEMPVSAAAFSPNGQILVAAQGGRVRAWDLEANRLHAECRGAGNSVTSLAFTPDGQRLVTAGVASQQALVKLWDIASGRETFTAAPIPGLPSAVAVSPDGRRVAVSVTLADPFAANSNQPVPSDIHVWDASP